jgi:hypothetical protein
MKTSTHSPTPDDAPVGTDEPDAGPDVAGGRIDVAVQGDGASLVLAAIAIPVVGEGSEAAGGHEVHPHRNAGRKDARPEGAEMGRVGDDRAGRRSGEEVAGDVEDEVDAFSGGDAGADEERPGAVRREGKRPPTARTWAAAKETVAVSPVVMSPGRTWKYPGLEPGMSVTLPAIATAAAGTPHRPATATVSPAPPLAMPEELRVSMMRHGERV